ncbi:MAG: hypothetical protein PHN75_04825 [Syntrophales bacterium]|nr:hypothetical protein [Syntrophales bacterium]
MPANTAALPASSVYAKPGARSRNVPPLPSPPMASPPRAAVKPNCTWPVKTPAAIGPAIPSIAAMTWDTGGVFTPDQ